MTDYPDLTEADIILPDACPACTGPGLPYGIMGNLDWYNCRNCGIDFYIILAADQEPEADQADGYTGHFFVFYSSPDVDQAADQAPAGN